MKKAIQIPYDEMFEKKCGYASKAGFEYISVNFTGMIDKTEKQWEEALEHAGKVMERLSLQCVQTHAYYYSPVLSSEIVEDRCELAIKRAVTATGRLGGGWCAIHLRTAMNSGFFTSKSFEHNKKCFSEYLELAIKNNTGIAAENLPTFPHMWPSTPLYSSNYEDLCNFADSFNDPHMGICWDTGHAHLMRFNQAEAIKYLGGRIKCTHIHNNYRQDDDHFLPDNGNIDWNDVMGASAAGRIHRSPYS